MFALPASLQARGTPRFARVLKQELEQLGARHFPLQQGLSATSYALDEAPTVMIIRITEEPGLLRARLGVFYSGIVAGCSCADDPTPVEPQGEYCEMCLVMDTASGEASISLATDEQPEAG